MIKTVYQYAKEVTNTRTPWSTFHHAQGEMDELHNELIRIGTDQDPGPDGVIGEAADVIICLLDVLYQCGYSEEQIEEVVTRKCEKWKKLYNGK